MTRKLRLSVATAVLLASTVSARVISYAPYTDRSAAPALQHRMNRYFVLLEANGGSPSGPGMGPMSVPPYPSLSYGQVVVYDSTGATEPRVVFPHDGTEAMMTALAVRESAGVSTILLQTTSKLDGRNPEQRPLFIISRDSGATWDIVSMPVSYSYSYTGSIDVGGPYARSRFSPVRIGDDAYPFLVAAGNTVYAIGRDATAVAAYKSEMTTSVQLLGTNRDGSQYLIRAGNNLIVASRGSATSVGTVNGWESEGWIASDGSVYLESRGTTVDVLHIKGGVQTVVVSVPQTDTLFAVPTFDYSGAWVLQRGPGKPTTLYRHSNGQLVKQWDDITAPEVEALHAGSSGNKVLIQVHRPRPQPDQRIFRDPALAVWTVGQGAPRFYDELFMNEQANKGFVHLDVEKIESGEPFVFDSGTVSYTPVVSPAPPPPPTSGGGDVIQEWGVVRASLKQRLVLPSVGRTGGLFDSYWVTDLIVQNPLDAPQDIELRFVPNGDRVGAASLAQATITLAAREIRLIEDALPALFGIETGVGAVFIDPAFGATVSSRTYSRSSTGTYGFAMNAIDIYAAAASPRFPVTFSGALTGSNFRTNLILTDTSGRGTEAAITAAGVLGPMGRSDASFTAVANGQEQINGIAGKLGLQPHEFGALVIRPRSGTAIASVFAVDNRTNDSTYFPPDLPAPIVRTIPVIGHLEGANGSLFRSDLYLYNPAAQTRTVTLQVKPWDRPTASQLTLTMLGREAKVIPDVMTVFGLTGLARLRYQSSGSSDGVRVTSRTYTLDPSGGTYGFLMPPLNNFQSGTSGDSLEILGAVGDERYRTNIGLVELSGFANGQNARARIEILDSAGTSVDSFEANVPVAGGMQLNDIFRARSIDVSGPVLIRVSPINGTIGAYATFTDNRTNDSSYLAANLGAKE